jgi:hypothetical protein
MFPQEVPIRAAVSACVAVWDAPPLEVQSQVALRASVPDAVDREIWRVFGGSITAMSGREKG